jgi:8-oxo-dGTP pyrophosphatase MutT (NUDIX family)
VLRIVVIERGRRGRHGGQLALPGGNREAGDADLRATAVRETCEEIGTTPDQVVVLGELAPTDTRSTGYRVWPFVARLDVGPGHVWTPQPGEVAAVHEPAVTELAAPAARGERAVDFPGWDGPRTVPVLTVDGLVVWGLTLRILDAVLPDVLAGRYPL